MALSKEILDILKKQAENTTKEEAQHMISPVPTYAKDMIKDRDNHKSDVPIKKKKK